MSERMVPPRDEDETTSGDETGAKEKDLVPRTLGLVKMSTPEHVL